MTNESLLYSIGITCIKGIGPRLAQNLIEHFKSLDIVFREKRFSLLKTPGIGSELAETIVAQREGALARAAKELEFIEKNGIKTYCRNDDNYPKLLKECDDAPIVLYGKGKLDFDSPRFVSVVGTRSPTKQGEENCQKMISDLAVALPDTTIVSGLAYGIDVCAHKAALLAGLPTIGVLAHGLDTLYPPYHRSVAADMMEQGGLVTEYMSGTKPDKPNFVQRNRIIAGLSEAVVVVESARRGGALNTARRARDYNRDVFTFPGRVTDEFSKGCHNLVKENIAALIESAEDLILQSNWSEERNKKNVPVQQTLFNELPEEQQVLLKLLQDHPEGLSSHELSEMTQWPQGDVSLHVTLLELSGNVELLPGKVYKIAKR